MSTHRNSTLFGINKSTERPRRQDEDGGTEDLFPIGEFISFLYCCFFFFGSDVDLTLKKIKTKMNNFDIILYVIKRNVGDKEKK